MCCFSLYPSLFNQRKLVNCFFACIPEGGYSTKFYTGRVRPEIQPFTLLFIYHFLQKSIPCYRSATSILLQQENKHNNNNNNSNKIIIIIITIIKEKKEKINVQTTLLSYIFVSFQQITFKPYNRNNFEALFPANFSLILLWSSRPPATFASIYH